MIDVKETLNSAGRAYGDGCNVSRRRALSYSCWSRQRGHPRWCAC